MQTVSRRALVRLGALMLPLAVAASGIRPAGARIGWCRRDPILEIDGILVRIDVFSTKRILDLDVVEGPTKLRVTVPKGASYKTLKKDEGFGKGWDIKFDHAERLRDEVGIAIEVEVFVPTQPGERLPVKVEIVDPGTLTYDDAGELVDKRRDDDLIESKSEDDSGAPFRTNEWIFLSAVIV